MLAGKTLTKFTNIFSPNNFKNNDYIILNYFNSNVSDMAECDSHNMYPNLNAIPLSVNISNDQQSRLNKMNEIKYSFIAEIRERELMSKNLRKYIASFEYLDKSLILSVATGSISIASFLIAIRAPVGIMSASCSLAFYNYSICKKVFKNNKK